MQEKAAKLHEQLHGSTFHIKLAQEAMKKVRQVEAEVAAKVAAEADALKAGTDAAAAAAAAACTSCNEPTHAAVVQLQQTSKG